MTDGRRGAGPAPRLQSERTELADGAAADRATTLLAAMTLEEKTAQLVGYWLDQNGLVAPMQGEMAGDQDADGGRTLADITRHGLGQFTRVYGTRPVEPDERAAWLWAEQRRLKRETRLGIPALVHEECLTGLAAWKAATFPTPLAWGAAFDPDLVDQVGEAIGDSMRQLGVHQASPRCSTSSATRGGGRVDECIGEDPYLVGTIGTAYVRGLQRAGVDATLKHFLGYSASQAGRNHAPVHAGPREVADVFLPPFEMALRDGGARSVMNSYAEVDGVPVAANGELLTDLLRDRLGFDGTVVADYFSVAFLEVMHGIAADRGEAAAMALTRGSTSSSRPVTPTCSRWSTACGPARWTRRSSTARCSACCARRSGSDCSTPTRSRTSRRPGSTSTRPGTGHSRRSSPRSRSSCCRTGPWTAATPRSFPSGRVPRSP